jgi:putative transposase
LRWRRKANRLPTENYAGNRAYLITIATAARLPWFREGALVDGCGRQMQSAAAIEGFELLAFVFMPDHLHILAQGSETSHVAKFIKRFKQDSGYSFKREHGAILWQNSYHDHILRREEDLGAVARYMAANPVRAGLVSDWEAYPYTGGSLVENARTGDLKVASTSGDAPW